ncbi:hypothetical protein D3C80_1674930 [compost metagenome]
MDYITGIDNELYVFIINDVCFTIFNNDIIFRSRIVPVQTQNIVRVIDQTEVCFTKHSILTSITDHPVKLLTHNLHF